VGPCRRFGAAYWAHFDSGSPNDPYPDGYGFYSNSGPYSWYGSGSFHHIDGCCYGWQHDDYLRVELDVDDRWVKWYLTRPNDSSIRDREFISGTNIDCSWGCALCIDPHDHMQRYTFVDDEVYKQTGDPNDYASFQFFDDETSQQREFKQMDGHLIDWGGQDYYEARVTFDCNSQNNGVFYDNPDGSAINCRDRRTYTHWYHGRWWAYRTSMWHQDGYGSITYHINYMENGYWMMGMLRGDYIRYYNHMDNGGTGDEYPDGWSWYSAGGGFSYYQYGGNFYHDRSDIYAWYSNDQVRVDFDLRNGARNIYMYINSPSRGYDWVQVCRWDSFDTGTNGIAFGGTTHYGSDHSVGDSFTIIDTYWDYYSSYDEAIADGMDISDHSPGSGVGEDDRDNRRALQTLQARQARHEEIKAGTARRL